MKIFKLFFIIIFGLLISCSDDSENSEPTPSSENPEPTPPSIDMIDYSFGNQGLISTNYGFDFTDASLQTDGKIILTGAGRNVINVASDFLTYRFDGAGAIDSSFGNNGAVVTYIPGSINKGRAYGVTVSADGNLFVVGANDTKQIAIAKYNSNGELDAGFGNNGIVLDSFSDDHSIGQSIVVLSDGKFVISGLYSKTILYVRPRTSTSMIGLGLIKYNADGSRDTSFGDNGMVLQPLSPMLPLSAAYYYSYYLLDRWMRTKIMTDDSGKLIVFTGLKGRQDLENAFRNIDGNNLFRYNPDGSLDSSFGTNGHQTLNNYFHMGEQSRNAFVTASGSYFISGQSNEAFEGSVFTLQKLSNNGAEDPFHLSAFNPGIGASALSVAVQSTGKILLSGIYFDQNSNKYLTLMRLLPDGTRDTSFADSGIFVKKIDHVPGSQKLLIDAQDRIYLAFNYRGISVYRFKAN